MNNKTKMFCVISALLMFNGLLLFSVIFSLFFVGQHSQFPGTQVKQRNYQFITASPFGESNEEGSKGFVTLPTPLEQDEFVSYINKETKSSTIITQFGGLNFQCTGSCLCNENQHEDPTRRTTNSLVLKRGIVLLFSAFTLSMASKIAEKTFQDQCVENFSGVCQSEEITSTVEKCEEEESIEKEKKTTKEFRPKYLCKGNCFGNDGRSEDFQEHLKKEMGEDLLNELTRVGYEKIGLCEALNMDKIVELAPAKNYAWYLQDDYEEEPLRIIHFDFAHDLNNFCEDQSKVKMEWLSEKFRKYQQSQVDDWIFKAYNDPTIKKYAENFRGGVDGFIAHIKKEQASRPLCYGSELTTDPDGKIVPIPTDNINCMKM